MINSPVRLAERTVNFSKNILAFCNAERLTIVTRPIINQLVKSATSIGANHAEANNAASKADFKSKIYIAKKEAAETKYWLVLLNDVTANKEECQKLSQECHYLLMTLQKIVNTLNSRK